MFLAKDIVRLRTQSEKINKFIGQLRTLSLRIRTLSSLNKLSTVIEEDSKAMCAVSNKIDDANELNDFAKVISKEYAKLDIKSELITDVLDGIAESMDNPEEQQKIYEDVLKEVGLEIDEIIPGANNKNMKVQELKVKAKEEESIDQILKQLQK